MCDFFKDRVPPPKRKDSCKGEKERHLTEGAVIAAFGLYLIKVPQESKCIQMENI